MYFGKNIISHQFHIVSDDFNIHTDGIIGKEFLERYNCNINFTSGEKTLTVNTDEPIIMKISSGPNTNSIMIPPRAEVIRNFFINSQEECVVHNHEPLPGVFIARTIADPKNAYVRVLNTTDSPQILDCRLTNFEPLADFNCFFTNDVEKNERNKELHTIVDKHVPDQHRDRIAPLLEEFSDIFALPNDMMTQNNFYVQKLRLKDNKPVYTRNYRAPHAQKKEIQSQIDKLIKNNLIEASQSEYNTPIILVPKKSTDGSRKYRMALDYRSVNKKITNDKFPLKRIDEILDSLGKAIYFSVMDMYCGFHQISLDEDSRDVTSFSTENGSIRNLARPRLFFENARHGIFRSST